MITLVPAYIAEHKSLTNCGDYKSHWMKKGSKFKKKNPSRHLATHKEKRVAELKHVVAR